MKILSINTGSSSLKFSLFEMNNEEVDYLNELDLMEFIQLNIKDKKLKKK